MNLRKLSLLTATLLALSSPALADSWKVDPTHSSVTFGVSHMMISKVRGEFTKFEGSVDIDEKNLAKSSVKFEVELASVDTGDKKRDGHLTSPDFFDVAKHPKMTFVSTKIQKAGKKFKVTGDLTLHGVTKPVTVMVELTKPVNTPFGTVARGASVEGEIDRTDFGITWNKSMDAGGIVVGEDVDIDISLELVKS